MKKISYAFIWVLFLSAFLTSSVFAATSDDEKKSPA